MSDQTTLKNTPNAISSQALADGATPCALPDGPTIDPSGPAPAHANLSARQAKEAGLLTSGTYGLRSTGSSASAYLASCLASKLRQKTALTGSTLFKLTWKERATPSGRSIPALRASARRTSDKDFTGWPTPKAQGDENNLDVFLERQQRAKEKWPDKGMGMPLGPTAQLASWPTPCSQDGPKGGPSQGADRLPAAAALSGWPTTTTTRDWKDTPGMALTRPDGRSRLDQLPRVAAVAGWPTPMAGTPAQNGNNEAGNTDSSRKTVALVGWTTPQAHDTSGRSKTQKAKHGTKHGCACLVRDVDLIDLEGPARLTVFGQMLTGSSAGMESGGQLNPAHSRWLMGYPIEWDRCAAMVTRSSRKSRQSSSRLILKRRLEALIG